MGYNTKIDWCDSSWNPVTGCKHSCEYCYARKIAKRFGGASETHNNECCHECQWITEGTGEIHDLDEPVYDFDNGRNAPYPFDFDPTFHRYKLDEPQHWKKPRTIFVCSMGDMFGNWVPDEWITEVFRACDAAPQHRYMFLTKNFRRYAHLDDLLPLHRRPPHVAEMWFGHSYTGWGDYLPMPRFSIKPRFVSIEPLLHELSEQDIRSAVEYKLNDWIIIGAETGRRKGKVIPEKRWVDDIADKAKKNGIPVYMKESLRELMGDDFRQEFPWEV